MRPRQLLFDRNPDYGHGTCRRMVAFKSHNNIVEAHLSDDFHEMRCFVRHDGAIVTHIESETIRIPTSACPAATAQLQKLIGVPIKTPRGDYYADDRARAHCTHLYDLAVLAIGLAPAASLQTRFEANVPDETDAPVVLTVRQDGRIIHEWTVRDGTLLAPEPLRGNTLAKGFARWAAAAFSGTTLDAATILARTWLIAVGRQFQMSEAQSKPIADNHEMVGRCFAYNKPNLQSAIFVNSEFGD